MGIWELLLLSVGLAMDAFAVSVCKGLAMKECTLKQASICGIWFGFFQALMPLIGYFLGAQFMDKIGTITPWVAFALLCLIGGNMIREAFSKDEEEASADLDVKTMFLMAVATSIDALAVGVTFACVPVEVLNASATINTIFGAGVVGIITYAISCFGVKIGNVFGSKYEKKAELCGGLVLIGIGVKIVLEALGVF